MKVLKFGGSSVGSAQGLRQVRRIVAANDGQIVVVVSALGGITDRLLATAPQPQPESPTTPTRWPKSWPATARRSTKRWRPAARRDPPADGRTARRTGQYPARRLPDPRPLAPHGRRDRQLRRTPLVGNRGRCARRLAALRRAGVHPHEDRLRKAHRRTGSDRKAHQGASGRPPPRVGSAGLHRLGLRHGRRDQPGARADRTTPPHSSPPR